MKRGLAAALALAAVAAVLSGCASAVQVDVDPSQDFSRFRTWDWMPPNAQWEDAVPSRGVDRGLDALVRSAIERELRERGYERAKLGRPDLLVAYHLTLERELVRRLETPAMQTLHNPHREGGFEVTASRRTVQLYETGTLVVVVSDGVGRQRIWRGTGEERVRDSFHLRAERLVSDVLDRFPPAWL